MSRVSTAEQIVLCTVTKNGFVTEDPLHDSNKLCILLK